MNYQELENLRQKAETGEQWAEVCLLEQQMLDCRLRKTGLSLSFRSRRVLLREPRKILHGRA